MVSCWPNDWHRHLLHATLGDDQERVRHESEQFFAELDEHDVPPEVRHLLPALFHNLKRHGIHHPYSNRIKGMLRHHWCKNQLVIRAATHALAILQEAKVPTLLLKGASVSQRYYEDQSLRPTGDVDIAVPEDRYVHAATALTKRSWRFFDSREQATLLYSEARRVRHAANFANERGLICDLHWGLFHQAPQSDLIRDIWQRAEPIEWLGQPTHQLCPTDQLVHTCLHGARFEGHPVLRWIVDACHILRKDSEQINWNQMRDQAIAFRMQHLLRETMLLLSREFEASIPDDWIKSLGGEPQTKRERKELDYLTKPVDRVGDIIRNDWYQHTASLPNRSLVTHLVTFPSYLKHLWKLPSYRNMPGYIVQQLPQKI